MQSETISNLKTQVTLKDAEREKIARDTEHFLQFGRNQITVLPGFTATMVHYDERLPFNTPHKPENRKPPQKIRNVAFVVKKFKGRAEA